MQALNPTVAPAINPQDDSGVVCGLVLFDKAAGISSQAVVSALRKTLKIQQIGHLGTLDPFATGLLPVMIGGATRLSDELMSGQKQYLFTIALGHETNTLDSDGQIVKQAAVPENFHELLLQNIPKFTGEIEQVPPAYSALKMHGKPLYAYMRANGSLPLPIESKKRKVTVEKLELLAVDTATQHVTLRMLCSKGTYVRSLARDLAAAIGTVGTCCALRREIVGDWHVQNALKFAEPLAASTVLQNITTPEQMLPDVPKITLDAQHLVPLSSGNIVTIPKDTYEAYGLNSNLQKVFVTVQNADFLFLANIENSDNIIKIKPRKKII